MSQFCWIGKFLPPRVWLYLAPFAAVEVVPKFHAQLSPFSLPVKLEYQAFRSGSVTASSSSCDMMEAIESAPGRLFGDGAVAPQADAHWVSALPTKAYLMSEPPMLAWV